MTDATSFTDLLEARGRTIERRRQIHMLRIFLLFVTCAGVVFTIFACFNATLTHIVVTGCWAIMAAVSSISANKDLLLCESILEVYDKVLIPEHKRN